MKDYTKEIGFWKRLKSFVSDVQTNCCMGEEEKQMIMHNCELKILDIEGARRPRVSDRETLKHKYFRKTEMEWVRRRDGYKFDNEECGLAIDHYLETGQEP